MPPTNNHPCTLAAESALAGKLSLFPRTALALFSSRRDAKAAGATTLQLQLALVIQAHQSDCCQSAFESAVRFMFSEKKNIKVLPVSLFHFIIRNFAQWRICSFQSLLRWLKSHCDHFHNECHGLWMNCLYFKHPNLPLEVRHGPWGQR